MARCERGYLCQVCGREVEEVRDSDLYLRYVLGEVAADDLHRLPDRHIRCNPVLAQFITDPAFPPVSCPGPFARDSLDPEQVAGEEARVTRAWQWLQRLPGLGLNVADYPLPPADPSDGSSGS